VIARQRPQLRANDLAIFGAAAVAALERTPRQCQAKRSAPTHFQIWARRCDVLAGQARTPSYAARSTQPLLP
jgi:hypothetical protein